jgi:hypothetical protein
LNIVTATAVATITISTQAEIIRTAAAVATLTVIAKQIPAAAIAT